ncbi:MAG: hypothetical protein LBH98_00545 [Chitinispirillales bacterium]|nr:hypothetical protein [Chitinispirillales bacterium]
MFKIDKYAKVYKIAGTFWMFLTRFCAQRFIALKGIIPERKKFCKIVVL